MTFLISLIFSIILGFIHFLNEKIFFNTRKTKEVAMSFVGGVSVAYIFLFLLPELYNGVDHLNSWIFFMVLIGFSLVHFAEKYFYQHSHGNARLLRNKEVHFLVLFIYYFLVGVILSTIVDKNIIEGILFFIPLIFYASVGKVSFSEVHYHLREQNFFRWLLALSSVLGVFFAPLILSSLSLYHSLLAFIIGSFLYISVVDFIPNKSKGNPFYFFVGEGFYAILIALIWMIR